MCLDDLPDAVQDEIVAHLARPHALLRQKPEMLRDAAALCAAAHGTARMGRLLRETILRRAEKSPERWLPLSKVSKTYLLRPADREGILQKIEFEGPRRRRWPVPYWSRNHVVRQCLQKYGGEAGFEAHRAKLERARLKRVEDKSVRRRRRRETLVDALRKVGCELRADSRLCAAFVEDGVGDPEDIACTMCEMKFFHESTSYAEEYEEIRRSELEHKGYYDRDEISECAKSAALRRWARQFGSATAARDRPELPESLRRAVVASF